MALLACVAGTKGMTLTRRTPLRRKSLKKRAYKTPRCTKRGCGRPAEAVGLCKSHALAECKRRWSERIREAGRCELAGVDGVACGGPLQGAHGLPKGAYPSVQFELLNGWCICAGHHRYYTDRWPAWRQIMVDRLGQTVFDELLERANRRGTSRDYAAVLASLG